jgi:hypothetical protein
MTSEPLGMEPSPFPEPEEGTTSAGAPRPWLPAKPLLQSELDYYAGLPWEVRTFNPWACMFNRNSEDGIGYYSGAKRIQCEVLLADPTKSRYCLDHAKQMGVDYYAPPELAEAVAKETATNLTRLVPKATRVLEEVMDDEDAPQGVRAKAASEILDRTGYVRGVDVRVDAQIATVDITAVIKDRLDALKDAHTEAVSILSEAQAAAEADAAAEAEAAVDAEVVVEPGAPLP